MKIDDEMLNLMVNLIEQKPTITLNEIQSRMITELPNKPRVTHQTISKKLDGIMNVLFKRLEICSGKLESTWR